MIGRLLVHMHMLHVMIFVGTACNNICMKLDVFCLQKYIGDVKISSERGRLGISFDIY